MEYHQITLNEYMDAKRHIKDGLNRAMGDFVYIGYWLKQVRDTEAYKLDGYASIVEFGKKECNLPDSAISRFMKINDEFSIGGNSEELDDKYKDYGSSKLSEMLTLSVEDRELIRPETAREDIRELKRLNKEKPDGDVTSDIQVDLMQTLRELFQDNEELFNRICKGCSDEEFSEYVNPGGNMTKRRGLAMVFFYPFKDGLKYKRYGSTPENVSYKDLHELFINFVGESVNAENPWKDFFGVEDIVEPDEEKTEVETFEPPKTEDAPISIWDEKTYGSEKKDNPTKMSEEIVEKKQEIPKDIGDDGIPGQDSILNHQEYLPEGYDSKPEDTKKDSCAAVEQDEEKDPEVQQADEVFEESEHRTEETDFRKQVSDCLEQMKTFLAAGEYLQLENSCPVLERYIRELRNHV